METLEKPRETETFWRNHIVACQESRQSKTAYAKAQGLKYMQLLYWFGKLTKGNSRRDLVKWVPVKLSWLLSGLDFMKITGLPAVHATAFF